MSTKLLFSILCFFVFTLKAQEDFTHYTSDQGLPSSEVYDVLCDRKGFVWISTDRGVSRFNGYTFENFYTSDGLTDNVIIELFEDKQNRIWFSANSGRLCYYDYADARIHAYAYNDSLLKNLPARAVFKSIRLDRAGTLFIGYLHYGAVSVTKAGKLSVLAGRAARYSTQHKVYFREVQGQLFQYSVGALNYFHDTIKVYIDLPGIQFYKAFPAFPGRFKDEYMQKRKNGTCVFSVPGYLLEVSPGKEPLILPVQDDDVRRIYEDSQGRLWICFRYEGLRVYEPGEGLASNHYKTLLSGKYTNAICEDKEQGMWTGVYNDALYYRPGMNVKVEKLEGIPESQVIRCFGSKGPDLYIGTESNRLYCLHANRMLDSLLLPVSNVLAIHELDSGLMVYGSQRCYISNGRMHVLNDVRKHIGIHSVYKTDSVIYAGTHSGILRYMARPPYSELSGIRLLPGRNEAIFHDRGRLLIGNTGGVYMITGDTAASCNHWFDKPSRTTSIQVIKNYLVFSSLGEGIRFMNRSSGKKFTLKIGEGLLSNNINALCTNGQSLWAAGSFGLNEIRFSRDSFRVYSYTLSNGLKVSEIRQLKIHNKRLWMITSKGIYSFGLSNVINNPKSIPVHILSVTNGDKVYRGASLLGDPEVHFNSILKIHYVGLSYKQYKNIKYRYRLLDKDDDWAYTMNTEVEFAFLAEGHYTFELSASNEDGEWSPPVRFRFFIEPPFWRTWWFIFGTGLLVLTAILSVFVVRIRRLREENRIREQLYDYRQQALVARMNPHFIFNSLNSIHYFILNEDKGMAGKYLARFASLMRMTLDFSTREYVTLKEDIRALELYLELEAWRFKDKFRFVLEVANDLNTEAILVPPMLVQPFVENAINHGLLNRIERGGTLEVKYRLADGNLECMVEDNGVGREEAGQLRQNSTYGGHRSAGVSITRQRLETACEKNRQAFLLDYIDKIPATHSETGTLVRFYIPFMYDKNTDH
jgi:ligand-binding sensor domain-containing protein